MSNMFYNLIMVKQTKEKNIFCSSCNKNITKEMKKYEELKKTYSYNYHKEYDLTKPIGKRISYIYNCRNCFSVGSWLDKKNKEYEKLKGK